MIWSAGRRLACAVAALVGLFLLAGFQISPSAALAAGRAAALMHGGTATTVLTVAPFVRGPADALAPRRDDSDRSRHEEAVRFAVRTTTGVAAQDGVSLSLKYRAELERGAACGG